MEKIELTTDKNFYFIGIAGVGMSALAQFLKGKGIEVKGSDRIFGTPKGNEIKEQLEILGIKCFDQNQTGINKNCSYVVVSTAIEPTVPEYQLAIKLNIPIIHRSDLLAEIANSNFTIAIAGTSGKSTTTAIIFHIFDKCGLNPSIISGAGLISLQKLGLIGNTKVGKSDILVIESDESDGTIIKYKPQIGVILNIDKDHKDYDELIPLFETFAKNTKKHLIVNSDNTRSKKLSNNNLNDFSVINTSGNQATDFKLTANGLSFISNNHLFEIPLSGYYNMENTIAAISVARLLNIDDESIAESLKDYEGIYRRHQIVGIKNGVTIIDDYAHNPAKIIASIKACQLLSKKVVAWFQPHGFAPMKFMQEELTELLIKTLRYEDEIWFSDIYYAGGTADKTISPQEITDELKNAGIKSGFIPNREDWAIYIQKELQQGDILLLMGARDPSLEYFAKLVFEKI